MITIPMLGNGCPAALNLIFITQARRKGEAEVNTDWANVADARMTLIEAQHDVADFVGVHENNEAKWDTRIVQIYEKVIDEHED